MPNHVTNIVTFLGGTQRIKELREKCKGDKELFSFKSFCPAPVELVGTTSPAKIVSEAEMQEWKDKLANGELSDWEKDYRPITQKESQEFMSKYGADNWYTWNIQNWGTKWDCYSQFELDFNQISFSTAWSTPMVALLKLSQIFDDITIEVRYADEDFGANVGTYSIQGGVIVDVYQPEYSKESLRLAMEILGDKDYFLVDRLCEIDENQELEDFDKWLIELAHEEGNLIEAYPLPVIIMLKELAIREQDFKRATVLRNLEKLKLNLDNMEQ
jgi:hypothetical protein